jgi:Ca2+-binding EF-hand superfamily protein
VNTRCLFISVPFTVALMYCMLLDADRDRNGVLDVNEFLIGIRGELNERRRKMVRMAFNILDKDRSGE